MYVCACVSRNKSKGILSELSKRSNKLSLRKQPIKMKAQIRQRSKDIWKMTKVIQELYRT